MSKTTSLFANPYRKQFGLTTDYVFHAVYARNTEKSNKALIALLNVILDRKADPIVSIKILNPIDHKHHPGDKITVMDIKAITSSGELINIEMQSGSLTYYVDRTICYSGRLLNSSLEEGQEYDKMKPCIVISFINGAIFKETERCHTVFYPKEAKTNFKLSDKVCWHFIELGKVSTKKSISEMSAVEKLAAYMKYAHVEENESFIKQLLETNEEAIKMSEDIFRELTEDDIEREYLERVRFSKYMLNTEKSIAMKEGERLGENNKAKEIVKNMLAMGIDTEVIAKATGLSVEEVGKI